MSCVSIVSVKGSAKKTYYELLGVSESSELDAIREAYHRLARLYHPDFNPNDIECEALFREIQTAFDTLKDVEKRQQYDRMIQEAVEQSDVSVKSDKRQRTSDLFFKGNAGFRCQDIVRDLYLTPSEAKQGAERELNIKLNAPCAACSGKGYEPGSKLSICEACNGSGTRSFKRGQMITTATCSHCFGRGRIIEKLCQSCRGERVVLIERSITISIPVDSRNGDLIKKSFNHVIDGHKVIDRLSVRLVLQRR